MVSKTRIDEIFRADLNTELLKYVYKMECRQVFDSAHVLRKHASVKNKYVVNQSGSRTKKNS